METVIEPRVGCLDAWGEVPETLLPPSFTLELSVDHGWVPLKIKGACWDETVGAFLIYASYVNDTGRPQLCLGQSRALFCGRPVIQFATTGDAFVLPIGATLNERWPVSMQPLKQA